MHHQAMVLICVIAAVAFIANFIIKGLFTKDRPCDLDETVDLLIRDRSVRHCHPVIQRHPSHVLW